MENWLHEASAICGPAFYPPVVSLGATSLPVRCPHTHRKAPKNTVVTPLLSSADTCAHLAVRVRDHRPAHR